MSESKNKEYLSTKALGIISIIDLAILIVGLILLGLDLNEAFYSASSTIRAIFEVITYSGETIVFIIIIAFFYIVYDKKFAKNLAFNLLFCVHLNSLLKDTIKDPRPSTNVDHGKMTPENPIGLIETGYGFPSGHTQNAVSTWGYMAYEFKDKSKPYLIPIVLSIVIFLVAISRIIIGMHDLHDIIGGLLIGIGFLIAYIYLEPTISEKIDALSTLVKIVMAVVFSLVLFLIPTFLFPTTAQQLLPIPFAIPFGDEGAYAQVGGAMLGLAVGYVLENEYVNYEPSELDVKQKIINLIIGMIILLVVYFSLELLLTGNVFLRFIRYAVVAFVLTFLGPIIFKKIK